MLDDIRLTPRQSALLARAASKAGGTLDLGYRGTFAPASDPVCVGLRAPSPGVLMKFGALAYVSGLPDSLVSQLAARICEDYPGNDASRVYYWPGITCPEVAGGMPEMPSRKVLATQLARHRLTCLTCAVRLDGAGRDRGTCPQAQALIEGLQKLAEAGL